MFRQVIEVNGCHKGKQEKEEDSRNNLDRRESLENQIKGCSIYCPDREKGWQPVL